jgi:hypothetical protein
MDVGETAEATGITRSEGLGSYGPTWLRAMESLRMRGIGMVSG